MTRWVIWLPGLAVAVGAAVATAHGLYEVAIAARVPTLIAWLYPLITDGLALVAYAATARLEGRPGRYAWSVVVLAAGLSGLAQAVFLASGAAVDAPPLLRFGIGAWPAVAAAIVAHLLYLLATHADAVPSIDVEPVQSEQFTRATAQAGPLDVQPIAVGPVQSDARKDVQSPAAIERPALASVAAERHDRRSGGSPARDRARAAAARHAARHGHLPTVTELESAAEVSRGTAAAALKALREQPSPLHLIPRGTEQTDQDDDPTIEKATQP